MLVYEKKSDGARHLFGNASGTQPTADDVQLTYKDAEGSTLTLSESDTYLDDGKGGIIRKSDNKAVNVFIGDTQIIGKEIEVEPTPELTMTGIEVTTKPTKLAYTEGEALDLTGMVVTLIGTDGTQEVTETLGVNEYVTNPVDGAILTTDPSGKQTVTVSAFDFEDSFDVTVSTGEPEGE